MSTAKYETSPPTPTEIYMRRRKRIGCLIWLVILILLALLFWNRCSGPKMYSNAEKHFKYGSIGSDIENGLPVELLKVLPKMFAKYLPEGENSPQRDLTAFGFLQEEGKDLPIGFSYRQQIIPLAGINCAACHTGVVRSSPDQQGEYIVGMPANQLRLQEFFGFLFDCVADPDFTADNILAAMKQQGFNPGTFDRFLYSRLVIPQFQGTLLLRKEQLREFFADDHPGWGAGRVDTFNPYKRIQFAKAYFGEEIPRKERIGNSDFPSLWNQGLRAEMDLHWDGNNCSVSERNLSAAFGAGATRENVDHNGLGRIKKWIRDLEPPKFETYFPNQTDKTAAKRGGEVYKKYCYDCHDPGGKYVGTVDHIDKIGTSPWRLNSYTEKLVEQQLKYGEGYSWQWKHFHKTNGYANAPLDGIWARAPYLHNGSVPTMWDLLTPADQRSQEPFFRGHGVYDTKNLGIRTGVKRANDLPAWEFDVTVDGNQNMGHTGERYGTELSDSDKRDLIEFLKTL